MVPKPLALIMLKLALVLSLSTQAVLGGVCRDLASNGPQCPADPPLLCSNPNSNIDTCCFETPGGVLLQTQFWDYSPSVGAEDEWTLHGLWPDNCDGSYEQFCDSSLNIDGTVELILVGQFQDHALYEFMTKSWKDYKGDDENLWVHEFNKHGTCILTLKPKCYTKPTHNQNIYDYFKITVELFKKYPTYQFLTAEGIEPSTTKTYTKQQIQDALDKHFGGKSVYFKCDSNNALNEVWYFHHLKGSILGEQFVPIDALSNLGCPALGIKWIPKGKSGPQPTTTGGGGGPSPTGTPAKGLIKVDGKSGCLISNGKYYESGTCATFLFTEAEYGGHNIKSSKGYCGLDASGAFACGSLFQPSDTQFNRDNDGKIGYGNNFNWCLGLLEGSPPQTYVLNAGNGKCNGKTTFALLS